MGIFDFFKKKSKPQPQPENQHQQPQHEHSNTFSVFKDERFPISADDFYKQKSDYSSISDIQKAAIIMYMNSFIQGYFIEDTYARQLANSLLALRKEMLAMSFDKANNLILRVEDLGKGLFSISSKTVLDHLLQDMKYLLKLLVSVTIRYQDGAKVNKEAINTLYGLFIPLGYEQLEVYNPMDFIYL